MPFTHGTTLLPYETRGPDSRNGDPTWVAALPILGKIQKKRSWALRGESERESFLHILHVDRHFSVNIGDRVDGFEIADDFGNNKYDLK